MHLPATRRTRCSVPHQRAWRWPAAASGEPAPPVASCHDQRTDGGQVAEVERGPDWHLAPGLATARRSQVSVAQAMARRSTTVLYCTVAELHAGCSCSMHAAGAATAAAWTHRGPQVAPVDVRAACQGAAHPAHSGGVETDACVAGGDVGTVIKQDVASGVAACSARAHEPAHTHTRAFEHATVRRNTRAHARRGCGSAGAVDSPMVWKRLSSNRNRCAEPGVAPAGTTYRLHLQQARTGAAPSHTVAHRRTPDSHKPPHTRDGSVITCS